MAHYTWITDTTGAIDNAANWSPAGFINDAGNTCEASSGILDVDATITFAPQLTLYSGATIRGSANNTRTWKFTDLILSGGTILSRGGNSGFNGTFTAAASTTSYLNAANGTYGSDKTDWTLKGSGTIEKLGTAPWGGPFSGTSEFTGHLIIKAGNMSFISGTTTFGGVGCRVTTQGGYIDRQSSAATITFRTLIFDGGGWYDSGNNGTTVNAGVDISINSASNISIFAPDPPDSGNRPFVRFVPEITGTGDLTLNTRGNKRGISLAGGGDWSGLLTINKLSYVYIGGNFCCKQGIVMEDDADKGVLRIGAYRVSDTITDVAGVTVQAKSLVLGGNAYPDGEYTQANEADLDGYIVFNNATSKLIVRAAGTGLGGDVELEADGDITVSGNIISRAGTSDAGDVEITSGGEVSLVGIDTRVTTSDSGDHYGGNLIISAVDDVSISAAIDLEQVLYTADQSRDGYVDIRTTTGDIKLAALNLTKIRYAYLSGDGDSLITGGVVGFDIGGSQTELRTPTGKKIYYDSRHPDNEYLDGDTYDLADIDGVAEAGGTLEPLAVPVDNVWTNGAADNAWGTAGNWSLGHVPTEYENVIFTASADISGASTANCNAAANTVASGWLNGLAGIDIRSGYTGTITMAANFAGGTSQALTVRGDVTVDGGAAAGGLVLTGLVETKTFAPAAIDIIDDLITIASHGYANGDVIQITTSTTMPGGLTSALAYHVGNVTGSTFSLHTNITDALAGTNKVNITSQGAGTHTSTRGVGATINCYNFTLASGKVVHSDARGFSSAQVGPGTTGSHFFGATHGGRGGGNTNEPTIPHPYGSPAAITLGSGTLSANGGGAICINASATASISGRLSADAGTGSFSSASGGSIRIVCDVLSGSGEIRTNGGTNTVARAGGGGGRIFISYSSSTYSGTFECAGGKPASAQPGIAGTLQLPSGANLTVTKDVGLPPGSHTFGVVAVQSNATLVMHSNPVSVVACSLTATSVTVDSGSTISANAEGYALFTGPGSTGVTNYGGSGHGGRGGGLNPGLTNGVVTAPVNLGSSASHYGGGAIKLVAGSVAINGTLTANGRGRFDAGAGGSIWVVCTTLSGSGTISALGGTPAAESNRGGGGGGRIALAYDTNTFSGTVSAAGGVNSANSLFNGELGSILPGSLCSDDHVAGQAANALASEPYTGKVIYGFTMCTPGNQDDQAFENAVVNSLVFDITSAYGFANADINTIKLYEDLKNDGVTTDDSEVTIDSATVSGLTGGDDETGTLTLEFSGTNFTINDTAAITASISGVNTTTEVVTTSAAHGLTTGQAVRFDGSGIIPVPLKGATIYYVNVLSTTTFSVHTTRADALSDSNRVNFTSAGSGTRTVIVYKRSYLLVATLSDVIDGCKFDIQLNIESGTSPNIDAYGAAFNESYSEDNAGTGIAELTGTTTVAVHDTLGSDV